MQDLLKGARYVLASAANWQRAQKFMGAMVFPVILYDRLFDIADWRLAFPARGRTSPDLIRDSLSSRIGSQRVE
jgi:hypothetical protein